MGDPVTLNKSKHARGVEQVESILTKKHQEIAEHRWRDHFHYTAKAGWINDPCGLIQYRGKYHLFVQHHPFSGKWGQMHWAHAVSDDLIHWQHLPEALVPSETYDDWQGGGIFTGSAIEHQGKLILFYTGCAEGRQTQCMAISEDGSTFEKFAGNPVIKNAPEGMNPKDFRDPKVWKHGAYWYMVTGTTSGESVLEKPSSYERNGFGKVALHRSQNLIDWEFVNYPVESRGELGTMLECPNLFELDGKYVLMYSPMGLEQRQVVYLSGDFDYKTGKFYWSNMGAVDWGFDYYAPQFFTDDNGRTIIFGWVGSWPFMNWYNEEGGSSPLGWCGSISLPRRMQLCADGKLSFEPTVEVEKLRRNPRAEYDFKVEDSQPYQVSLADKNHCEILADFDLLASDAQRLGFEIHHSEKEQTRLVFDLKHGNLIFERNLRASKKPQMRHCPLESAAKHRLQVHIFIDSVTLEVFTDNGRTVMTNKVYSSSGNSKILLFTEHGNLVVRSLKTFSMNKIGVNES